MERIPTPTFESPVQWLRVGDMQLHLFLDERRRAGAPSPRDHDRRLRRRVRGRRRRARRRHGAGELVELPSGQVQLYFRDPAGNLIELNWPDADDARPVALPRARRLADHIPQTPESLRRPSSTSSRRLMTRVAIGSAAASRRSAHGARRAPARAPRSPAGRCSRCSSSCPRSGCSSSRRRPGKCATTFGSAVHDPKDFLITLLNGVTAAALYFVVASGFTLIFGLMRVVNMAHGAFFLLGGYIALKLQRDMVGEGGVVRAHERAGQPDALDRAGARRHARRRRHRAS